MENRQDYVVLKAPAMQPSSGTYNQYYAFVIMTTVHALKFTLS